MNCPVVGVPEVIPFSSVDPLNAVIVQPLPVRTGLAPLLSAGIAWASLFSTTVNAFAPDFTPKILIESKASTEPAPDSFTFTCIVFGVLNIDEGTLNEPVALLPKLPAVPSITNWYTGLLKFWWLAVSVIVPEGEGFAPSSSYTTL